jgi:hypothetical protein
MILDTSKIYIALLHHPVYNKTGEVITTAITNLDLHDISRTARTYGIGGYYVINPMPAQRELARRILAHWIDGFGAVYNPNRTDALSVLRVAATLDEAASAIEELHGARPQVIGTAARLLEGAVDYIAARDMLSGPGPALIVFGTGWGLTDEFLAGCDRVLMPITGHGGYNHLPVRAAVAIILDRLISDGA